jgi:hypothetical protein
VSHGCAAPEVSHGCAARPQYATITNTATTRAVNPPPMPVGIKEVAHIMSSTSTPFATPPHSRTGPRGVELQHANADESVSGSSRAYQRPCLDD